MRPIIIDRRKNPGQKNLSNRERFIERFRGRIKEAARKHIGERRISDTGDQEIILDKGGIDEPRFRHTRDDGQWDYVLPGNEKDRKSTRLNSSHVKRSRMPSSA